MENLLKNPDIDLRYCISWANEKWTNGWVSDDNRVLIDNDFDDEDSWSDHFHYLEKFLKDPRYICEDGKPILIIYVPHHIRKIKEMLELWQKLSRKVGLPGIKFIYQHPTTTFCSSFDHQLFDYGIEFQPQYNDFTRQTFFRNLYSSSIPKISSWMQKNLGIYVRNPFRNKSVGIRDYDRTWEEILGNKRVRKNMIASGFIDWDNTPRKGNRGYFYRGSTPAKFGKYFKALLEKAKTEYSSDFVFLFAWNEWAEGGYLEPDEFYKYEYLKALKNAKSQLEDVSE